MIAVRRLALAILPNVGAALAAAAVVVAIASPDLGGRAETRGQRLPAIGDHWHAVITIEICGERQPNPSGWEGGVHTHNDGIVHVHPFQSSEEGAGARLSQWFKYGGGLLEEERLRVPGTDKTWEEGDACPDGRPGQVSVTVISIDEGRHRELTGDALEDYVPQDGDEITVSFGPP